MLEQNIGYPKTFYKQKLQLHNEEVQKQRKENGN